MKNMKYEKLEDLKSVKCKTCETEFGSNTCESCVHFLPKKDIEAGALWRKIELERKSKHKFTNDQNSVW